MMLGTSPVLVLDPGALADPVERERALARLLRYQSQVLTARLGLGGSAFRTPR